MCGWGRTRRAPSWALTGAIRGLLPVGYWEWGCSGDRLPLFAAAAGGVPTFACLSGGCCLLALLLVFMAHWEWRRYGSRDSQLTYAGVRLSYGGGATAASHRVARRRRRRAGDAADRVLARRRRSVPDSGGVWGSPDPAGSSSLRGSGGVRHEGPAGSRTPARRATICATSRTTSSDRTTPRAAPRSSRIRTTIPS